MPPLAVRLLGAFSLSRNGHSLSDPTAIKGSKARALAAYLLTEKDRTHSRARIAGLFWPDMEATSARANLRQALLSLRNALEPPEGPPLLQSGREKICLHPEAALRVDLDTFLGTEGTSGVGLPDDPTTLERMAAAYAGPFLADLAAPEELEEFGDWLRGWRHHLHERAVRLLTRLAEIYEERGDSESALEHGQRLLTIAPHHEAGHRRVMTLLARRGQTNAALRHYDQCRNHLAQELGVQPEEATRQLRDHILEGRVGVEGPRPPSAETGPALLTPERRQVTILACALEPAGTRDPEARAAALGEAVARIRACLEEHAGHVVHSHGGSLLAYFGYPSAREDSPRRALAAARAVLAQTDTGMEVQLGVHSEVLVTGTDPDVPDPGGLATERTLALRNRAPARTALVSPELRHLAPAEFPFRELPSGDLHLAESAPAPESGLGQGAATAPFVGREAQLSWLSDMARWARTAGFRGVLLQGEAGVGKTRLVEALAARLTRENFEVRTFACRAELVG
ncbi:MAG TPA: BTAD domain-containing putative transcriptional regulator, partial [Gammaproteobacteria bacterium]|nr:BTAD domain-containing putative transcriptional regulator [Gammaproteobacteria bacterium]